MTTLRKRTKKFNNSKYRFHQLQVGQSFTIDPLDKHSMLNSLNYFNKRHGADIELYVDELSSELHFTVTRIK